MSGPAMRLRTADRTALAILCLLLAASVSARVSAGTALAPGSTPAAATDAVDLGNGVSVLRRDAVRRSVWIATCPAPVTADFVEPSPHGSDTSLASPPNPNDRVVYLYRGWTLEGRRAAMELGALYFMRRAAAVLRLSGSGARDELAVKVIVPDGCSASPGEVMAHLGLALRPEPLAE
ncbi:hypothetical protein ACFQFG_18200 [Methylobacterium persicinum]|nr:hypothetical protein KHHGKMAE_4509 [Methylobacterium persicinum]